MKALIVSDFEPRPFGKYFLTDKIAVGGMAEIYKAKSFGVDGFEKVLAIKKILSHYSADKEFITMLTDEAKLVVNLSHTNIVQVYDLGRVGNDYFISMEYVDSVNLRELTVRATELRLPIPTAVSLYIIAEVCKGLDYAHSRRDAQGNPLGIVHRDMSPQNILVSFEGEVKIVDFGIAKAALNISQTNVGTLKGKVTYMSPEQAVGKSLDYHTDLFSCGIVLYELLTGKRLFRGETQLEVLKKIRSSPITEATLDDSLSPQLKAILARALAYNPRDRYQNAGDMQVDLIRLLYATHTDFSPRALADLLNQWFRQELSLKRRQASEDKDRLRAAQAGAETSLAEVNLVHRSLSREDDDFHMESTVPEDQLSKEGFQELPQESALSPSFFVRMATALQNRVVLLLIGAMIMLMGLLVIIKMGTRLTQEGSGKGAVQTTAYVEVDILSNPAGADIYLDGRHTRLKTPALLEGLVMGKRYQLRLVKEGYEPLIVPLQIDSKTSEPVGLSLVQQPPRIYALTLRSTPPGAAIFVDGEATGKTTPAEFADLIQGRRYTVRIQAEGFSPYERIYTNEKGLDQILDIRLKSQAMTTVLIASQPPGAAIWLDNKNSGFQTPHTFSAVEIPVTWTIRLVMDGFSPLQKTIQLNTDQPLSFDLRLNPEGPTASSPP